MTTDRAGKKVVEQAATENAGHEKAHWLIEQAGELGITDDMDTKRHMLDAYCEDHPSEKALSD